MSRPSVELGSFVTGEVPLPLDYQFLDADGVPLNLTGFASAEFHWGDFIQGQFVNTVVGIALVTDAVNGVVTYSWSGAEFIEPGPHVGMFFVNNGTTQYASILIIWQVCLAVGLPPAV
jgi:hypothetical protein